MTNSAMEYNIQPVQCTYLVHIHMHYPDRHSEFLPDEEDNTAFVLEELVGHTLLTLFDSAIIDEVTITDEVTGASVLPGHIIHLYARCPHHAFPANPDEVRMMECTLEHKLGCAFLELFDMLVIEQVEVRFIPTIHT